MSQPKPESQSVSRRPMVFRAHGWATALARQLTALGVTPNAVSLSSIVVSLIAAILLVTSHFVSTSPAVALLLGVPLFVALRGICNLIDGMIAVEGGKKTASGEVFNDFPDRVSDVALFVGTGYAVIETEWGIPLGWLSAVLAVCVAYTRMLGGAVGAKQYFTGPMGKPARMAVLTLACIAAAGERLLQLSSWSLIVGLSVIILGSILTIARRLSQIVKELEAR